MRALLLLPAAAAAILLAHAAKAEGYRPTSMEACLSTAVSTYSRGECYQAGIDKLTPRLPPRSERWRAGVVASCEKASEGHGTSGIAMSMTCVLDAIALRIGAWVGEGKSLPAQAPAPTARDGTPTFSDPLSLVTWLLQHSGRDFDYTKDSTTVNVFSPGLRTALRNSFAHSRQVNEPPCGANGDIILASQEIGPVTNLRLSVEHTASDRATVSASFDIMGYHRDRQFMTVILDSACDQPPAGGPGKMLVQHGSWRRR